MRLTFIFCFFQAEDGIRDWSVTGVQTCALPISGQLHLLSPDSELRTPDYSLIFVVMNPAIDHKPYSGEAVTAVFNPDKQHTLKSAVSISGTGLHTGVMAELTFRPAGPGFGLQFQRVDLPDQPIIKADCDLVTDVSRGTTLEANGAKVNTREHVLAALVGMGVDNCLIQVNGPEVPIMDGSSEPFVDLIEDAGVLEQDADKIWYTIDENISHYDE